MELTRERAEHLVAQAATAHRIVVAFYQRMLPQLDEIATGLDMDFWYWEPIETGRPCRSTTRPSSNWAWDMVPLYAANFVYRRVQQAERVTEGDLVLQFSVYFDTSFDSDERKRAGLRGEPDALTLPAGRSEIQAYLCRCTGDDQRSFEVMWRESEYAEPEIDGWQTLDRVLEGKYHAWQLADLVTDSGGITEGLRNMLRT